MRERRRAGRPQEAAARGRHCRRGRAQRSGGSSAREAAQPREESAREGYAQPFPVKKRWKDKIFYLQTFLAIGCSIHGGFDRRRQGVPLRSHGTESVSPLLYLQVVAEIY